MMRGFRNYAYILETEAASWKISLLASTSCCSNFEISIREFEKVETRRNSIYPKTMVVGRFKMSIAINAR